MPPDTTPVFRNDALRAFVALEAAPAIAALSAQPPEHLHQASTHGFEHTVVSRQIPLLVSAAR